METLKEKIASAVSGYEVKGLNGFSLLTTDSAQQTWVMASIAEVKGGGLPEYLCWYDWWETRS